MLGGLSGLGARAALVAPLFSEMLQLQNGFGNILLCTFSVEMKHER
jgi:hypothetical protein